MKQGNNHKFVCGLTQSGKSYFVKRAVLQMQCPVLYMNIQGEDLPQDFYTIYTSKHDIYELRQLIEDDVKINMVYETQLKGYEVTAGYLLSQLMTMSDAIGLDENKYMYVVLDECHLLTGWALRAARYIATAGLKKGIRLICVTQRPALCDKTLYTQAFEHYIFFLTAAESAYMKNKGIDYEQCQELWKMHGDHSYCYYNGYVLEGREPLKNNA